MDAANYLAAETLKNGIQVRIRSIRTDDKKRIYEAFHNLESESIYTRFFQLKKDLTEKELRTATEVDFENVVALIALTSLAMSCASTDSQPKTAEVAPRQTGFLAGYYEIMQPGPEGGAKMRWLKPGVDFGKYDKVMIDNVIFYFDENSEDKGIDAEKMKELADACNLRVVNALKDSYPIVGEAGPGVVRIRFAITDLKRSKPGLSAVSSVIPVGLGISLVRKGAGGSWSGSGATSAEIMALDATTGDVIAVARDDRTAGFTERFSSWGSAKDAFQFWGERIKLLLDDAHGVKQ